MLIRVPQHDGKLLFTLEFILCDKHGSRFFITWIKVSQDDSCRILGFSELERDRQLLGLVD